jgi:crotonobetaine/carnitine-CoA ligase
MTITNPISIADLIAQKARTHPDLDVLTFESNGDCGGGDEIRTYRQLWENGQKIAAGLRAIGVRPGMRIALLLQNHPEFVEMMVAAALVGAVLVPIDPRTRGQKLAFMLRDSGCSGAVCAAYSSEGLAEAAHECPDLGWVAMVDAAMAPVGLKGFSLADWALADWLAAPLPDPLIESAVTDPAQAMELMYTSGTTGDPKGIVIPHARFMAVIAGNAAIFGFRADDRPYTGLSLTHGNAQFITLGTSLWMGLRAVISRRFTKSRLWPILGAHGCTVFNLLGGMVTAIYSEPERPDDADNPVRRVISAGMPAALWEKFARRFDVEIFEFFGAMEGGMTTHPVGEGPIGSCGRVAPGQVAKVIDEQGNEVPPGNPGEIVFRLADGPWPPVQYHNQPDASARKVVDGWLHSGDIVMMDADGWVFFQYRKGGGIRRNGDFINPAFVERALAEHPAIDDVFVYGVPAAGGAPGEKDVVAAIVPKGDPDPQAILRWARKRLEANMAPTYVQIVTEIPKTASEKPQERFLLQMFADDASSVHTLQGEQA